MFKLNKEYWKKFQGALDTVFSADGVAPCVSEVGKTNIRTNSNCNQEKCWKAEKQKKLANKKGFANHQNWTIWVN